MGAIQETRITPHLFPLRRLKTTIVKYVFVASERDHQVRACRACLPTALLVDRAADDCVYTNCGLVAMEEVGHG